MASISRRRKTDSDPYANQWASQITRLERQVSALQALQETARRLTQELDLDQLLAQTMQSAVEVMQASAGSLMLLDPETKELVFKVVQGGGGQALLDQRFPSNQGIAGAALVSGQPSIVHDVTLDSRFLKIGQESGFAATSIIAVPLIYKGNAIGVIEVLNKKSGERFNDEDKELLLAFAAQSAVAIENARLYQQVVHERDRMLVIEEQVRRRLARDLHDGPSQLLSAMIMNLRFLKDVLTRKPERSLEEIANIETLATQALHQVRNLLFLLRPVLLETQGLIPALKALVDKQREGGDLNIQVDLDPVNVRLAPLAEAAVFSIVQEAIGNVRKHAQAKKVVVRVRRQNGQLMLSVQDDGCGFDVQQVQKTYGERGSLGMLNMTERAQVAQGKLTVESELGKGTQIKLLVPIPPAPSS